MFGHVDCGMEERLTEGFYDLEVDGRRDRCNFFHEVAGESQKSVR